MSAENLSPEELQALPVGQTVFDKVGVQWEQTSPGRWWDKSYPQDTRIELDDGLIYHRYKPFRLDRPS